MFALPDVRSKALLKCNTMVKAVMALSSLDRRGHQPDNPAMGRLCRFQLRNLGANVCRPLFIVCTALWLSTLVGCAGITGNSATKDFGITISAATCSAG